MMPNQLRSPLMRLVVSVQSLRLGARCQSTRTSAAGVERYKYEPLSKSTNIRLLKIRKGDGEIHCSMVEAAKKTPNFEALSYTWGSPTRADENQTESRSDRVIYLNKKSFTVTNNLFDALLYFRDLGKDGYLWIDAICIDQGNIDERGEQVRVMGDIYSNADRVIVWLGKEDDNTQEAVSLISAIVQAFGKAWQESAMTPATFLFNDPRLYFHTDPIIPPLDIRQWRLIIEVFTRTWFSRVWILQEVTLAKEVTLFCGTVKLDYNILTAFSFAMSVSGWVDYAIAYTDPSPIKSSFREPWSNPHHSTALHGMHFLIMAAALNMARTSHAEATSFLGSLYSAVNPLDQRYAFLEMSITYSRQLKATDLSDKVYAPLSLASQFSQHGTDSSDWIHPDYSQDFTTTFINVSHLVLKHSPSLSLLSQVEDRKERILQQLPSWVPDFSVAKATALLRHQCQYDASRHWGDIDDRDQRIVSPSLIRIFGSVHEVISKTTAPLREIFHCGTFQALLEVVPTIPYPCATKQDPIEALWRTLIGNSYNEKYPAPANMAESFYHNVLYMMSLALMISRIHEPNLERFWNEHTLYKDFAKSELLPSREAILAHADLYYLEYLRWDTSKDEIFLPTKNPLMAPYQSRLDTVIGDRCLISTKNDLLGLAPNSAKPSDNIAFVRNSPVPFIIRKVADGKYELVGEAYIHGLMHGELGKEGPVALEEIILQ